MAETRASGVRIDYDDLGSGEPALLLLPGWCSSRALFRLLAPLAARQRRVLALDWRGHGQSQTPPGDFGEAALVADALAVIAASGAQQVVPAAVAHSGWVAFELRRRLGPRVPRLVLLDWLVLDPPPPFLEALQGLQDPERWQQVREQLFALWTQGVDTQDVHRFVREDMGSYGEAMWARAGREIAAAYQRHGSPVQALARLSPPPPTLHLYAQPDDPGFLEAQQAFAARHPWFQARKLAARSHFPALEAPDLVEGEIERFLRQAET